MHCFFFRSECSGKLQHDGCIHEHYLYIYNILKGMAFKLIIGKSNAEQKGRNGNDNYDDEETIAMQK